jgi:hypothetical protein
VLRLRLRLRLLKWVGWQLVEVLLLLRQEGVRPLRPCAACASVAMPCAGVSVTSHPAPAYREH